MNKERVFVTGATGSVGHYLLEELAKRDDLEVFALVRNPSRFKLNPKTINNLTIVDGCLERFEDNADLLKTVDYIIHIATTWCGNSTTESIPYRIIDCVNPSRIKKIILFSTASILGRDNKLLLEAETIGSTYIKDKYKSYLGLSRRGDLGKVIHIYPTVVIGGDDTHPFTHIGEGLLTVHKQIGWLRFLTLDMGFHFIHSRDIARIVAHMLTTPETYGDFVLGNDYVTLKDLIRQVARFFHKRVFFQFPIPIPLINAIVKLFRIKADPWGLFCLNYRHFQYKTVNAKTYGLPTDLYTIGDILASIRSPK